MYIHTFIYMHIYIYVYHIYMYIYSGRLVQEDEFVHKDWVTSVVLLGASASQDGCKGGSKFGSKLEVN